MNKYFHKAGLIVAAAIPLFILPARISEGQLNDPVNLIGSEIVIFLMSLTCWYSILYFQKMQIPWQGFVLSVLCCCLLSNVFYFAFNPFFKDFPFRTAPNPLPIKILMLSSRGILISVILIPASYFLKRDQEARYQRKENERLAIEKIKIENRLLEKAVDERTEALNQALNSLEKSQRTLEHQIFVQSRLLASITHDICGPFQFLIIISKEIGRLNEQKIYNYIGEYNTELIKSLEKMYEFIENMLEFTKLPVIEKLLKTDQVNLARLINEKAELFEGIIKTQHNVLRKDLDDSLNITTNSSLVGIVLHNLIDNANKHTLNGVIYIRAFSDYSGVQIVLENSGNKLPDDVSKWINSGQFKPKVVLSKPENYGIGLILIKEISELLSIKVQMQQQADKTIVTLVFN